MAERDGRSVDEQLATGGSLRAGKDVEQLVLALALERDHAEHLAGLNVERHIVELRTGAEAASREARRRTGCLWAARRPLRDRGHVLDDLAQHELDDAFLRALGDVHDTHGLALAQDRGPVAHGGNLDHPMGDEDHGPVAAPLAADHLEDSLGEVRG